MTRPIKFRAWDKEARKFLKPEPRLNAMTISITLNGEIIGHPNIGEMTSLYELSQFTGLTDKNDKEIYEGDVVNVMDGADGLPKEMKSGRYIISWSSVHASFVLEQVDKMHGISFNECMIIEVIGNVYEHPELQEGGTPA